MIFSATRNRSQNCQNILQDLFLTPSKKRSRSDNVRLCLLIESVPYTIWECRLVWPWNLSHRVRFSWTGLQKWKEWIRYPIEAVEIRVRNSYERMWGWGWAQWYSQFQRWGDSPYSASSAHVLPQLHYMDSPFCSKPVKAPPPWDCQFGSPWS